MCNTVCNAVTNTFVTLPLCNATPDPTRPDPYVVTSVGNLTLVCGSWVKSNSKSYVSKGAALGLGPAA